MRNKVKVKNKLKKIDTSDSVVDVIENIDETSSEIKDPFDPTKITITVKPLIIDSLIKRMVGSRIDLNTEFQRRGNLWKPEVQSRLIESLLVRIPLPAFYFDGSDENLWEVVDGLQRLHTLKNFVIDKKLKLSGLEYLKQYTGNGFDDLPPFLRSRIEETHITAYLINPGTPSEVKFNIFKRINTGGLPLKPQEIRNALNQGIPTDFVKELTELPDFAAATDYVLQDAKRMEDGDFVVRFIAFYDGYTDYKADLDAYLNDKMSALKKLKPEERSKVKRGFIKAMKASFSIFGKDAFRKRYDKKDKRKLLNKALFDSVSVNLAKLSENEISKLSKAKDKVISGLMKLMSEDDKFDQAISSGTGKFPSVKYRFDKISELFKKVINA